jgi:uncharacterized lipoprotein NlpE involved in copper resistance
MKLITAVIAVAMLVMIMEGCTRYTEDGQTVAHKLDRALDRTNLALAEAGDTLSSSTDDGGSMIDSVAASVNDRALLKTLDVADAGISASIKSDLVRDPSLGALRIDVDSRDGVVSLTGQADDEANRRRAEQVARGHKSVIGVRNNLTVNPL